MRKWEKNEIEKRKKVSRVHFVFGALAVTPRALVGETLSGEIFFTDKRLAIFAQNNFVVWSVGGAKFSSGEIFCHFPNIR